jgi:ribosome biogenesis GTPase / thiamine phosphate phosphatase
MNTDLPLPDGLGIVYSKTIGKYGVWSAGRLLDCALSSRLQGGGRARGGQPRGGRSAAPDPVAVGDVVRLAPGAGGTGQIVEVLPRRNKIARRSAVPMPDAHAFEQVIVANVDQVVPVFAAAQPAPKWNLLDRYLALAEATGVPALICVTKADLAPDVDDFDEALDEYRRLGYRVALTSAASGAGLEDLAKALHGRVSVLLGKSGVGKTSLLNALEPGLGLRVSEVSRATGKGRHTTSQAQLFPLAQGGALVDTPGTREFGLWDIDPYELALYFREMRPWVGQCKFGLDCRHDEEPGCAIRQGVMGGQISARRYQSYMRLRAEA